MVSDKLFIYKYYNISLQLFVETWPRDIWGLIDYEAKDLINYNLELEKNGYMYRHIDDIFFSEDETDDDNCEKLFEISKKDNSDYILTFNKVEYDETENISSINNAWFLLKPEKMDKKISKYKVNEGDIIKIGRITIRIKEIKLDWNNTDYYLNIKNGNNISNNSIKIISSNNNSRIMNEIIEISSNKKYLKNNNLNSVKTTNQTNVPTNKNIKMIIKQGKVLENNNNIANNEEKSNESKVRNEEKENNSDNGDNNSEFYEKQKISKNNICRICFMEEDDKENNPLLDPCICAGSMKFIHIKCLQHWISSKCYTKIETMNKNCQIYKIKPLECELCKTPFPDIITKNENNYIVNEFKPEYDNYLVFESLTLDKNKNKYNYIIELNKNDKKVFVGRDKESHVLFSDISVSRTHCIFNIENDNIYIIDNDSTFGTLVLMQSNSIKLIEDLPLYIQIGRTFFKILVKKKKSDFFCCNISESPNDKFYFNQNEKQILYRKKINILNLDENKSNDIKEINESNNEDDEKIVNIKKIKIKKNKDESNDNTLDKNKIFNIAYNANANTDKINSIKDLSINSKKLKIQIIIIIIVKVYI